MGLPLFLYSPVSALRWIDPVGYGQAGTYCRTSFRFVNNHTIVRFGGSQIYDAFPRSRHQQICHKPHFAFFPNASQKSYAILIIRSIVLLLLDTAKAKRSA